MSNVPWMSKWQRSPRQDRRVVENGKFVEQGQVQLPEPPPAEEQTEVNTALEVVHEPVNAGASADGNVSLDAPNGPSEVGHGSSKQANEADRPTEAGTVQPVSSPEVSTTEGQSVSEVSQTELEPLPGDVLTEEQSDALAETLRLPEPTDEGLPF